MKRRIHRSDEEWIQLITSCRQSGLSDKKWYVSNGIVVISFYNAVVRLRQKACQIPEREQNAERIYDLTASSLPDVVPISVIPENKTSHAAPALQDAAAHYDNSHMVQIMAEKFSVQLCNGTDPALVGQILSLHEYAQSIDGLCAVIQDHLQMNLSGSSLFLFCRRRCDRIQPKAIRSS